MDVKEAIRKAKAYVGEVYSDEPVTNVGLEETVYDDGADQWMITVAFSRPWNRPKSFVQEQLSVISSIPSLKRSYKVITLRNTDGSIIAMRNRESADF